MSVYRQLCQWFHWSPSFIPKWLPWIIWVTWGYSKWEISRKLYHWDDNVLNGRLISKLIELLISIYLVIGIFGSDGESGDSYEIPESTPASQGYKNSSLLSTQEQFALHNSKPETPTIQSGEGPSIETLNKTGKINHFVTYQD